MEIPSQITVPDLKFWYPGMVASGKLCKFFMTRGHIYLHRRRRRRRCRVSLYFIVISPTRILNFLLLADPSMFLSESRLERKFHVYYTDYYFYFFLRGFLLVVCRCFDVLGG